jgi:hypothetical protein
MVGERGTSESDLSFIGFGPYGDNLSRLDGGIDHKQSIFYPSLESVNLNLSI